MSNLATFSGDSLRTERVQSVAANPVEILFPSSLTFKLTDNGASVLTDSIDTITYPNGHENSIKLLENKCNELKSSIDINNNTIAFLAKEIKDNFAEYTRLDILTKYPAEYIFTPIEVSETLQEVLPQTILDTITSVNKTVAVSLEDIEFNKGCKKTAIEDAKNKIKQCAINLCKLTRESTELNNKLLLEQMRALRDTKPAKVLTGDEILSNYYKNAVAEEVDGDF
jgi:type II secretory pathway component HofQ